MAQKNPWHLSGRVVLITGASRGIGAAVAVHMAELGARVAINYLKSRKSALSVLRKVEGTEKGKGIIVQADVTQRDAVNEMEKTIRAAFGPVDILVNNAPIRFEINPVHQISWDGLRKAIEHELSALYNCVHCVVPGMMAKKRGKIIIMSSRLAQQPLPKMGAYAAAKGALEALANTMAVELGPFGITVNIVTPAFTLTEGSRVMPEGFSEKVRLSRPLQKHLYPEDIAGAVAFLASDQADMITGSNLLVSGGSHLKF